MDYMERGERILLTMSSVKVHVFDTEVVVCGHRDILLHTRKIRNYFKYKSHDFHHVSIPSEWPLQSSMDGHHSRTYMLS